MYALVDCNSCYASCEQIFRPDLRGQPVVVLSNNDGCIVARSKEAKGLGIPDLEPYFKLAPLLKKLGVQVFSSNYPLYGDTSARVMQTLNQFSDRVEIYSIDEMFLELDGFDTNQLKALAQDIRQRLWQEVRMPVGVGIAPTKTLAKLANHAAKKFTQADGVCVLDTVSKRRWLMQRCEVKKVWGVGSKTARKLNAQGIINAWDLARTPAKLIRKDYGVTLERTVRELNGEACLELEQQRPDKQQIYCTRSFGDKIHSLIPLQQAACTFAARACEKLRAQNCQAKTLQVFIHTSRHSEPYIYKSTIIQLPYPSNDTRLIEACVREAVKNIYQSGCAYAKAGVGIIELCHKQFQQSDLFNRGQSPRSEQLMRSLDTINNKFGRGTLVLAAEGLKHRQDNPAAWQMRQNLHSPRYTTCWSDIPTVRC